MWLKNAILQAAKPKHSIIGMLKLQLGGQKPGRTMDTIHASDITDPHFCPRRWAFFGLFGKKPPMDYLSTALDVTFQMGSETERLLVEEWGGDAVIGNWRCRYCGEQRTMVPKPSGTCQAKWGPRNHWWEYRQLVVEEAEPHGVRGGIDALFNVGAPQLLITEVKTLNPEEFDKLLAPFPEHRLRTNLYMRILEQSSHPYREKINTTEAKVLYISRGYGKRNQAWDEVLPFKEFAVKRHDGDLAEPLKRAAALKLFRHQGLMPAGICSTALDKLAKNCSVCQQCFSGKYPAGKYPPHPEG